MFTNEGGNTEDRLSSFLQRMEVFLLCETLFKKVQSGFESKGLWVEIEKCVCYDKKRDYRRKKYGSKCI